MCQVCRFIVGFIVDFSSGTHGQGPWCFFSNKKYFVLIRFFLRKNWHNDIRKNKTKIINSMLHGTKN